MSRFAIAKEHVVSAIDDIVPELFGGSPKQSHRYGGRWAVLNRWRGDAKLGQMSVWRDGGRRGAFKDYAGTAKGDAIDLVAYGLTGEITDETRMRALEWIEHRFGIRNMSPAQREDLEARARTATAERNRLDKVRTSLNRSRARKQFYSASEDLAGTAVERYLRSRSIELSQVPNLSGALRTIAACDYWPARPKHQNGQASGPAPKFPALVSCMVDAQGHVRANHFTFVEPDGSGKLDTAGRGYAGPDGRPLSAKLMFPETAGLFVPVTYGPSGKKHYEAAEGSDFVGETEGIEDALSAALDNPQIRMHAMGSLSGYLGAPDLACAKAYLLFRDNDWGNPQAAAQFDRAVARHRSFGKPVEIASVPADWGKDMNDALRAGA